MLKMKAGANHCCLSAFLLALLTATVMFVPFIIFDKGYFFFFGDFNVQQIPFYKLAHEAVQTGDVYWNWYTDLGANFVGSYSFYLIGSPFFWLTLLFPTSFVPHLMGPLLILKHACAAFTSCLYLKRFVKNPAYAVFGSILYAFSGFAVYNIFFNHFHEAIIAFPLLLVGLEERMVNNRHGLFALGVAINAFVNYWFFIGEVVFTLLYFFIRMSSDEWRITIGRFFLAALESVIGLGMAMCLLLPSVIAIMGNPRTGVESLTNGWNLLLYWHAQMYPAIFTTGFFPPDLPSRPNLFPDRGAKWASLGAFLPLISMSGVIAYIRSRRDWLRRILLCCIVAAFVPALNSAFILFNESYYARWFYMPILLMAMASARAMENTRINLRRGLLPTAIITLGTVLLLAATPDYNNEKGEWSLGLTKYPAMFAAVAAIAVLGLCAFALLVRAWRGNPRGARVFIGASCVASVIYGAAFIGMGRACGDNGDFLRDTALKGRYELELDDSAFCRADLYDCMDNLGMYWHLPNIQAFHSIIPVSTMEFYPLVGVKRDVSSKPETQYYPLRGLLSVRWQFVKPGDEDGAYMPGFYSHTTQLDYKVYENEYFIPMGFTLDGVMPRSEWEQIPVSQRAMALMKALVLEDERLEALEADFELSRVSKSECMGLYDGDYFELCKSRMASAGSEFVIGNRGFTSRIELPKQDYVFYSVPYDAGWSATVNGSPVPIERADVGFMAVLAPAGDNEIRFEYHTPGASAGAVITAVSALALFVLVMALRKKSGASPRMRLDQFDASYEQLAISAAVDDARSFDEALANKADKKEKRIIFHSRSDKNNTEHEQNEPAALTGDFAPAERQNTNDDLSFEWFSEQMPKVNQAPENGRTNAKNANNNRKS